MTRRLIDNRKAWKALTDVKRYELIQGYAEDIGYEFDSIDSARLEIIAFSRKCDGPYTHDALSLSLDSDAIELYDEINDGNMGGTEYLRLTPDGGHFVFEDAE